MRDRPLTWLNLKKEPVVEEKPVVKVEKAEKPVEKKPVAKGKSAKGK